LLSIPIIYNSKNNLNAVSAYKYEVNYYSGYISKGITAEKINLPSNYVIESSYDESGKEYNHLALEKSTDDSNNTVVDDNDIVEDNVVGGNLGAGSVVVPAVVVPIVTADSIVEDTVVVSLPVVNSSDTLKADTGTETELTKTTVTAASVGTVLKDSKTNYQYVVTSKKNKTVAFSGSTKKIVSNLSIPSTVKVDGVTYKVTSIGANALKNNKKVKKITIGSNIEKIGKNAFYGCENLTTITIKSANLTAKNIGKNAFKGISNKVVVKVPKKKLKAYKKIFEQIGVEAKIKSN
jgi:hypothetical protein